MDGEYYHVFNRGVDKRKIFLNDRNYEKFLFLMGVCNDRMSLLNSTYHYRGLASIESYFKGRERNKLVDIISFCLMPNHFHLLLKQVDEKGISKFLQKISTGYTMYFNNKNDRNGSLFQGTFKAIHIDHDKYLKHLINYIHSNPLEIIESKWKEDGITDLVTAYNFIKNYKWSSLSDYFGSKKFSMLIDSSRLINIGYDSRSIKDWISKDVKDSNVLEEILPYTFL